MMDINTAKEFLRSQLPGNRTVYEIYFRNASETAEKYGLYATGRLAYDDLSSELICLKAEQYDFELPLQFLINASENLKHISGELRADFPIQDILSIK